MVAGATTFPPQFGGAAKGKRLNGQARRLTSPHLEVLCRTSKWDYKAPLCGELLMKGLLCGALLSHRPAGGRWCRKAPKGGHFRRPQGGCMVFAAKGGIRNGAEGAVPPQWNGTSYLPRAEPSTRPGGVSRSRTEPWQPRAERPGGWLNPHARKGVSTFGNT